MRDRKSEGRGQIADFGLRIADWGLGIADLEIRELEN
jgi:hypothetical protein